MPYGSVCGLKGNLDQVPKRSLSLIIILDGENREEEWSRETSSTKLSMSLSRPHRRNQDFENYLFCFCLIDRWRIQCLLNKMMTYNDFYYARLAVARVVQLDYCKSIFILFVHYLYFQFCDWPKYNKRIDITQSWKWQTHTISL